MAREPRHSFGTVSLCTWKAAPHNFPLPRHGSCLGFRCPHGTRWCLHSSGYPWQRWPGHPAVPGLCEPPDVSPCSSAPLGAQHYSSSSSLLTSLPGDNPLPSRDVQPRQGTLPGTRRCTGRKEQGCSQAGTAKPWQRAALGAGLKLQPSFLHWPFPAPPALTHCPVQLSQPPGKVPQCQTQWFAGGALLNRRKRWC